MGAVVFEMAGKKHVLISENTKNNTKPQNVYVVKVRSDQVSHEILNLVRVTNYPMQADVHEVDYYATKNFI